MNFTGSCGAKQPPKKAENKWICKGHNHISAQVEGRLSEEVEDGESSIWGFEGGL